MDIYNEAIAAAIVAIRKEGKEPSKVILGKWVYAAFKNYQNNISEGEVGEDVWFGLTIETPEDVKPDHFSVE